MTDKVQKIKEWISKTQDGLMDDNGNFENTSNEGAFHILSNLDYYIDSLQEESISEDLEEASIEFAKGFGEWHYAIPCFQAGAKWQENHLWKPADGDDLPEIDREVVVLTQKYPLEGSEYDVSFAHRPYKGKYIGKSLVTGNIETFENKTYDKGGWNQPNVKWWLDCGWPKQNEE